MPGPIALTWLDARGRLVANTVVGGPLPSELFAAVALSRSEVLLVVARHAQPAAPARLTARSIRLKVP